MAFDFDFDLGFSKPGEVNFDLIQKLLDMDTTYNRTNRMGLRGGWQWEQDPETGQWTQNQVITDPAMQYAHDRMSRRLMGEGFEAYEPPAQFSALMDAKMADQMQRHGLLNEETMPNLTQQNYGTRFGDRQGGAFQNAMTAYTQPMTPGGGDTPPGGQPPPGNNEPPPPVNTQPGNPYDRDKYYPPGFWKER